jgi:hypothetical protein
MRVASFGGGLVSVTESGRFAISMDGHQWRYPALPQDVSATHPAITLHYFAEDVAFGPKGIVVQGFATSSVEPAAVEAAYPEIGPVIDVSRIAPCSPEGDPMPCELASDDALWVQTIEEDWQAVSLSGMGLEKADIWRAYRVLWHSTDGESFETVEQGVLSEHGYGPDPHGLVATDAGFVMIDEDETVWTSHDGGEWEHQAPPPYAVTDLFSVGSRVFGTNLHQIVEYLPDGSWTVAADASSLRALGFNEVVIEAVSESAYIATVYEEDVLFPELAGQEPLSIARILGVSLDGATWTSIPLEDALGASGAVEVGITGDRIVVVLGPNTPEDFVPIVNPEWWIGTIDR